MNLNNFGASQSPSKIGMIVRIGLASFALVGSLILAWSLLNNHTHAHAATNITKTGTTLTPWGLALDTKNGHIWVAKPGCDASPICTPQSGVTLAPGAIGEYSLSNDSHIQDFTPSSGENFIPVFLALDSSGNIWFTDPTNNAIGEIVIGSNGSSTWTEQTVPTPKAEPYDLVFDSHGNIWFTEIGANQIGFYDVKNQKFAETPTPSLSSNPYGITLASNGDIWFTENSLKALATFTPTTADSPLPVNAIKEITIGYSGPHLITTDKQGNVWYSEGFTGYIGELTVADGKDHQFNVSLGACPQTPTPSPTPIGTPPPSCGVHISGIGVDSNGMVWFDDSLSFRVGFLNPSTDTFTAISVASSGDANPHPHDGLVVDSNNNVWVSEEFGNNLDEITGGSPTPTPPVSPTATAPKTTPPGPVAKTWYFAEGRIGKGFREYLTIDNPSTTTCGVDITYLYTPEGTTTPQKKVISNVQIQPTSRQTEVVNDDIGLKDSAATADDVASTVTMNSASTCGGVMVERPVYFVNYHGISSGTDVAGLTTSQLSTSFYFADVASDANHISYLTILNPGSSDATVTANYYAGGKLVGTQNTKVTAGSRGTLAPGAITKPALPSHSLAIVTSTTPIMVERPTYFIHESMSASGAYDVVGAPAAAADWFFAEGYTYTGYQENLTVSNPDPSASAAVTVILKSQTGVTKNFTFNVAAQSQYVFNVNQNDTYTGSSPEVSAEVQATGAKIVVQREMYFQYGHKITGFPTIQAMGGTDVMGQVGPISKSAYSFAEGYTAYGYNEWLTLQNPTNSDETITITMTNSRGQSAILQKLVKANSRSTVDITAAIINAFHPSGTDTKANAIAMTVQTLDGSIFVAERPEYFNTNGSSFPVQGGTDIIGFGG